jgi:hypothetical protein
VGNLNPFLVTVCIKEYASEYLKNYAKNKTNAQINMHVYIQMAIHEPTNLLMRKAFVNFDKWMGCSRKIIT